MAQLVRNHALDLVHVVRGLDQAGLKIDGLAGRNESIDLRVVQKDDVDAVRIEPGRHDQRPRHVLEQQLGLGVTENGGAGVTLILLRQCWLRVAMASSTAAMNSRAKRASVDFIRRRLPFSGLNPR